SLSYVRSGSTLLPPLKSRSILATSGCCFRDGRALATRYHRPQAGPEPLAHRLRTVHDGSDFTSHHVRSSPKRIDRKVRIPRRGGWLCVPQKFADHRKAHADAYRYAGKAVTQVVETDIRQVCLRPHPSPRPPFLPAITCRLPAIRGMDRNRSIAGSLRWISLAPVLESGSRNTCSSRSTYSHRRVKISDSLAPVRIKSPMAAMAKGLSVLLRSASAKAVPSRRNSSFVR